jgi:hypothetical protein
MVMAVQAYWYLSRPPWFSDNRKEHFMKQIFFAAVALIFAGITSYGQSSVIAAPACTLKPASAPAVRGLKLGMKIDDVLATFPGRAEKEDLVFLLPKSAAYPNFGLIYFQVWDRQHLSQSRFAGINSLGFTFLDGNLVRYDVQYASLPYAPPWRNVDDFIAKVSDAFHLPPVDAWTVYQGLASEKALKCDGFRVRASNLNLEGRISVETTEDANKIKRDRLAAFEDKTRSDFKP